MITNKTKIKKTKKGILGMPFDLFSAPIYAGSADYLRPFSVFNRVMDRNYYGWTQKDQENNRKY